jgi:hypothetical protein
MRTYRKLFRLTIHFYDTVSGDVNTDISSVKYDEVLHITTLFSAVTA